MDNIRIIMPTDKSGGYRFAAEEFASLAMAVTGCSLPLTECDDGVSDLVLIGSDAVNSVVEELLLAGKIPSFSFRFSSDDYEIVSHNIGSRRVLILAGGRLRSTIYAVYTYFERYLGCRWFWDGDIIPRADALPMEGISLTESPRFEYRGLRYFAHRALHRFQAEHWDLEDWKREIRWMLKKRLNLFMLRIGTDDLFQRAFPNDAAYPPDEGIANPGKRGYNERTTAWPLKYRGELREQILKYAFERDLMHPEDCGTITHWYSPTPRDFMLKVKPETFVQAGKQYTGNIETLVWDIRKPENFDRYMHLTDTHAREFGRPELFHTIGFAERMFSNDREVNMRMKQHIYNKTSEYIERKYPGSKLLVASWDMWCKYTDDEVRALTARLNPANTIFLDYTSDTVQYNNFRRWGLMGKFPYIIGIFHGFSRNSEIRGNYSLTDKCISDVEDDGMCKGLIFWPELSHSDTFMLEYFTSNAWSPSHISQDERIERFCRDRYGEHADIFAKIWRAILPVASLMHWSMDDENYDDPFELWTFPERVLEMHEQGKDFCKKFDLKKLDAYRQSVADMLSSLALLTPITEQEARDIIDIARTAIGRYTHGALLAALYTEDKSTLDKCKASVMSLTEIMWELLTTSEEYSMLATCNRMARTHKINPAFHETIKQNASNFYHRSCYMEQVRSLYIPELEIIFDWIKAGKPDTASYRERLATVYEHYEKTPLDELAQHERFEQSEVLKKAENAIKCKL